LTENVLPLGFLNSMTMKTLKAASKKAKAKIQSKKETTKDK